MFLKFIYFLTLNCVLNTNFIEVESCGSSSKCPTYTYKKFEPREEIISRLPNKRKIGNLALVSTHQSMSYISQDLNIRTQELSIADQLKYGVRVLDVSVHLQNYRFEIYSSGVALNKTLFNILLELEQFLYHHPLELVMLIIHYDDQHYSYSIDRNREDLCEKIDGYSRAIAGWRFVKNWTLSDTIGDYRGRILLATNDGLFEGCIQSLRQQCSSSKNSGIDSSNSVSDRILLMEEEYSELSTMCHLSRNFCFLYDMSTSFYFDIIKYNLNILDVTKFGLYDNVKNECFSPLNYRFTKFEKPTCFLALNIFIFDFVTQEIVDYIDTMNAILFHYDFD